MMSNKKKQQIRGLQRSISDSRMHRMMHNDDNNDDKNENEKDDGRHHPIEEDAGIRRRNPKSNPKHPKPRSPQVGIIDNTKKNNDIFIFLGHDDVVSTFGICFPH